MADSPPLPTCKGRFESIARGIDAASQGAYQRWSALRRAAKRHTETSCGRHDRAFVVGGMGVLLQHLAVTGLPRTGAFDPCNLIRTEFLRPRSLIRPIGTDFGKLGGRKERIMRSGQIFHYRLPSRRTDMRRFVSRSI